MGSWGSKSISSAASSTERERRGIGLDANPDVDEPLGVAGAEKVIEGAMAPPRDYCVHHRPPPWPPTTFGVSDGA